MPTIDELGLSSGPGASREEIASQLQGRQGAQPAGGDDQIAAVSCTGDAPADHPAALPLARPIRSRG